MLSKLFAFNGNGASSNEPPRPGPANHGLELSEVPDEKDHESERASPFDAPVLAKAGGFDQIYHAARARLPAIPYGIVKVREMADSPHLYGMTPEAKRGAIMMALEAAGAVVEDLLQDAVARQRVLNEYEEKQSERLRELEAVKTEENRTIQADLDRLTGQYMARIQANLNDIARQQDNFHAWQKRKQQECQRMAEAATLLVPAGSANQSSTLAAVLERASMVRR
jgi:hypothetical protein